VAGHEISHGFDQDGRHYNENGALTSWWTNVTAENFEKRAACFVEQYGRFAIKVPVLENFLIIWHRMGQMFISMAT
jgi:endothelin-converting enzyme